MFGRATITLGIGPHSSVYFVSCFLALLLVDQGHMMAFYVNEAQVFCRLVALPYFQPTEKRQKIYLWIEEKPVTPHPLDSI